MKTSFGYACTTKLLLLVYVLMLRTNTVTVQFCSILLEFAGFFPYYASILLVALLFFIIPINLLA